MCTITPGGTNSFASTWAEMGPLGEVGKSGMVWKWGDLGSEQAKAGPEATVATFTTMVLRVGLLVSVFPAGTVCLSCQVRLSPLVCLCLSQVVLPSYEEAISLPSKSPVGGPAPPPYSEV